MSDPKPTRPGWVDIIDESHPLLAPPSDVERHAARYILHLESELLAAINIAGEAIGTDPSLRNIGCVEALAGHCAALRTELAEARALIEKYREYRRQTAGMFRFISPSDHTQRIESWKVARELELPEATDDH